MKTLTKDELMNVNGGNDAMDIAEAIITAGGLAGLGAPAVAVYLTFKMMAWMEKNGYLKKGTEKISGNYHKLDPNKCHK